VGGRLERWGVQLINDLVGGHIELNYFLNCKTYYKNKLRPYIFFKILIMIIQNKKRGIYEFVVDGQEFEVGGGSKHYHGGGGVFYRPPKQFFMIQVEGSVNEVKGLNPPRPPRQHEHLVYLIQP